MFQMMMRGGPPPSDKSQVGKEFDHYMRDAVTAQFPHSFQEPTQRTTDVWADRGVVVTVVDPSDRSTVPDVIQTSAKIINLVQFNRTPFDAHTQWALEVKYDDPDMHKQMLGKSYVHHRKSKKKTNKKNNKNNKNNKQDVYKQSVIHILVRCHPETGGTMYSHVEDVMDEEHQYTQDLYLSFAFATPPTPHTTLRHRASSVRSPRR